mgnify:CR=1 FL=1
MQVHPFSVTLAPPLQTAAGPMRHRRGFVVRRRVGDVVGIGEATPLRGWTESLSACAAALGGDRPVDPRLTPAAHHALEWATGVAEARAAEESVATHLGAPATARVPVNATVGLAAPPQVATAVSEAVDAGYGTVKIKLAGEHADVDRLAAAVDVAGDVRIRGDCNGAADRATANAICAAGADLGVEFIEQPLPPSDLAGIEALAEIGCPIAVDEGLLEHEVSALADAGVAVIICKPMVLGGPRRLLRIATSADAAGITTVVTSTYDAVIARTAAVHLAAAVGGPHAHGVATGGRVLGDIAPDPLRVCEGTVSIGAEAGLGGLTALRYDSGA